MKKYILIPIILFLLLSGIIFYQYLVFNDHKLHLVFCNVGQGDAIFIRTPNGSDVLIDGGPDDSVLSCISKHTPFWDRTLELVILTHPHADHSNGLFGVLRNYKVLKFATEDLKNNTDSFSELLRLVKNENLKINYVFAGDKFKLKDGVVLEIIGPTKEFLESTSPGGTIGESKEFGSVETLIRFGNFSALLTGDSQSPELAEGVRAVRGIEAISVLQVPHHGSQTGLTPDILKELKPSLAVISVGKNNYGHPNLEILKILMEQNIKTLRTDNLPANALARNASRIDASGVHRQVQAGQNGEIEIVSDGKIWKVN